MIARSLAFAAALFTLAPRALAAPPPDAAALSMRAHFEAGVRSYDAKPPDYVRALDEFRAAYQDKPSPIIKRNIALSLRGLGRYVEAIDMLEQMLAEGGDAITPRDRELAGRAIDEMTELVATARITITARAGDASAPPLRPALIVDGVLVPAAKMGEPVRLDPGEHRFRVHAEGYADAASTATFARGQRDVVIALELVPNLAPPTPVPPPASAPLPIAPTPPRYETPAPSFKSKTRPTRYYGIAGLAVQSQTLRLTTALDETRDTSHTFTGAAVIVRAGRYVDKYWDLGALSELGAFSADSYVSPHSLNPQVPAKTGLVNWVLAPELRVHTTGQLRLVASVAVGLEVSVLGSTLTQADGTQKSHTATGLGVMAMVEAGGQLELGRAFLESVVFFDVHGLGAMRDHGESLVADTSAARGGLRLLVGFRF